jgi:hypothetical protein
MSTQGAAEIAANIDLATAAGWNLRALLLRLAGGEHWNENTPLRDAMDRITRIGLAGYPLAGNEFGEGGLTPLGREVAERMRPVPWRVLCVGSDGWAVTRPGEHWANCTVHSVAERIAALLTRDDIEAAKCYRTEATP